METRIETEEVKLATQTKLYRSKKALGTLI